MSNFKLEDFLKLNDQQKNRALFKYLLAGDRDTVARILDSKLDINSKDTDGNSLLLVAVTQGDSEMVADLLKRKPNVRLANMRLITPLMVAISRGDLHCAKLLLDAGADVNMQDASGYTAIHWAVQSLHNGAQIAFPEKVIEYLISEGANPTIRSLVGLSPFEMAFNYGLSSTLTLPLFYHQLVKSNPDDARELMDRYSSQLDKGMVQTFLNDKCEKAKLLLFYANFDIVKPKSTNAVQTDVPTYTRTERAKL